MLAHQHRIENAIDEDERSKDQARSEQALYSPAFLPGTAGRAFGLVDDSGRWSGHGKI